MAFQHQSKLMISNYTVSWISLFLFVLVIQAIGGGRAARLERWDSGIRLPSEKDKPEAVHHKEPGTRWAVLVAGSNGYGNYRHQVNIIFVITKGSLFHIFFFINITIEISLFLGIYTLILSCIFRRIFATHISY